MDSNELSVKSLKPIKDVSLSEKAAEIIREMIISGECPMGFRFLEEDFAKVLNVSRASIRAAAMMLENDGLLVRYPNKSSYVVTFTKKNIDDIYHLRAAVEVCCLVEAMEKKLIDFDRLSEQSSIVNTLFEAGANGSHMLWIEADMLFHELIVRQSGNEYAYKSWKSLKYIILTLLNAASKQYPNDFIPTGNLGTSHNHILKLMLEGDMQNAASTLFNHILTGAAHVVRIVSE